MNVVERMRYNNHYLPLCLLGKRQRRLLLFLQFVISPVRDGHYYFFLCKWVYAGHVLLKVQYLLEVSQLIIFCNVTNTCTSIEDMRASDMNVYFFATVQV